MKVNLEIPSRGVYEAIDEPVKREKALQVVGIDVGMAVVGLSVLSSGPGLVNEVQETLNAGVCYRITRREGMVFGKKRRILSCRLRRSGVLG